MGVSKCMESMLKSYQAAGLLMKGLYRAPAKTESAPSPRDGEFVAFTN